MKVPVILEPEHREWIERQDFGLSEWIRDRLDDEVEREPVPESEPETEGHPSPTGEREEPKSEEGRNGSSPDDRLCSVCGERKATMELTGEEGTSHLCDECAREISGEAPREKNRGDVSGSGHICERCKREFGVEREAVKKVSLDSDEERWLCEACLQEAGVRQARRY